MKAIQIYRGVLAAAVLGALTPAFALSTSNSTTQEPRTSQALPSAATTMSGTNGARAAGTAKGTTGAANSTTTATATAKPLCSSFNNPQAGKLADKSTGVAKENSASPVHMDCTPDSEAAASAAVPGSSTANTGVPNPSLSGSTSGSTSSSMGSSPDVSSSVTGTTATMNPTIDTTATTDSTAAGTTSSTQAKKKTTSSTIAK